jgi:hypothetical protein
MRMSSDPKELLIRCREMQEAISENLAKLDRTTNLWAIYCTLRTLEQDTERALLSSLEAHQPN